MKYWMQHILPSEVDRSIDTIIPFLERLEPGYLERMSSDDILDNARERRMFFDVLMDIEDTPSALFILEIVHYPRTTALRVMGAVGDIGVENVDNAVKFFDEYFTGMARRNGYGFVEFEGRKGWGRKLKQIGATILEHSVVIRKVEVSHENSHQDSIPDDRGSGEVRAATG